VNEYRVLVTKRTEMLIDAKSRKQARQKARTLLFEKLGDDFKTTVVAENLRLPGPAALITALGSHEVRAADGRRSSACVAARPQAENCPGSGQPTRRWHVGHGFWRARAQRQLINQLPDRVSDEFGHEYHRCLKNAL
jgi:hypothetical protein